MWFSATPPLRADTLPNEEDGVQLILSVLITDSTENSLMQKILITMWYLWKARNDQRFGRKTWNTWQVHHAVAAFINTANSAISTHDEQDNPTQEAIHNSEAVTSSINASIPGINNGMTGMTTLIAGHNITPINPMYRNNNLVDRFTVHLPRLLPGVRCYTDASLTPDLQSLQPRPAGIGLFIINTQV